MKLILPSLDLNSEAGFLPELDIFKRVEFGDDLLGLIEHTTDELVIALDSPWGEGKSTFVKMWQGSLNQANVPSIYFDAFANDYQRDPFLAITSQLYSLIDQDDEETLRSYKENAISALKIVGRAGLKIGTRAFTAGLIDGAELLDEINPDAAANDLADAADKVIANHFSRAKEDQQCLEGFKDFLSKMVSDLSGDEKPVIFIIDELDRCKPKFALELVECIKHFFSTPKLVFVLVMNRSQLEASVEREYGLKTDAPRYLQKFISVWASLPKVERQGFSTAGTFINYCLKRMEYLPQNGSEKQVSTVMQNLAVYFDLSLRDIEKSLTNFAILFNTTGGNLHFSACYLGVLLCVLKAHKPDAYHNLRLKRLSYDEVVTEAGLGGLSSKNFEKHSIDHPVKWLLYLYMLSPEEAQKFLEEENPFEIHDVWENSIDNICRVLESFHVD